MYSVRVETSFCATHRVRLPDGTVEPSHGHDWRVRAYFTGAELDDKDMIVDFDAARETLCAVAAALNHADLNNIKAFRDRNPTAEVVARYMFEQVRERGFPQVCRVEVTEAPGCVASFEDGPVVPG